MVLTDTHAHLYLEQFDVDRDQMVQRAFDAGVKYMLLPNIDRNSAPKMLDLCDKYPDNLFPMIGLHPTDVKENFEDELQMISGYLSRRKFYAIGETGIDLYWDKTHLKEQKAALRYQVQLAKDHGLPLVLHVRESFDEIFEVIDQMADEQLTGVFHCFTGNLAQAQHAISLGFKLGLGGVLTYKNSGLDKVAEALDSDHFVLETDSPYLTPAPFRGKRNESAYVRFVAERLAAIKKMTLEEVARITTTNAQRLFKFPIQ